MVEHRSPKPKAEGSVPSGNARRAPYEGAARIAGHPAAKVLDAAAFPADWPLIFLNYIGENMEQAIFSSEKMDWETPQELFEALNREFDFTIDLAASPSNAKCSRFYTAKENALEKNWEGETAFLNPPYGRDCWKWIQKAYSESKKPNTVIVLLIAARTSNKEWHEYIFPNAKEIRFIRGRLKFTTNAKKNSSAPFPSAIVVFAKHTGCTEIKTMQRYD